MKTDLLKRLVAPLAFRFYFLLILTLRKKTVFELGDVQIPEGEVLQQYGAILPGEQCPSVSDRTPFAVCSVKPYLCLVTVDVFNLFHVLNNFNLVRQSELH